MLTEEFIKSYSSYDKDGDIFNYQMFKFFFNNILDKVYSLKSKSIFLEKDVIIEIQDLLIFAKKLKELFFHCNKKAYFQKIKITVHIFLLELEVNSLE